MLSASNIAYAAPVNFNGGAVANCTLAGKVYSCSSVPLSNFDDQILIANGYTVNSAASVVFTYNQGLTMSGTSALTASGNLHIGDINPANLHVTGGSLTASGGTFTMGNQAQSINANIAGAAIVLGSGSQLSFTGTVTSSGPVTIASNATINSPITGTVVTTNSPTTLNGNVTASVSFTLASGSTVTGNITAPTVTINASNSVVTGNVTASNSVDVGSGGKITGNVVTNTLTLQPSEAKVEGNVTATNVVLGYHGQVTQTIYCTANDAAGACTCLENNSTYPPGTVMGPTCAPTPPAGPHHIQISHAGSGLTCAPTTVAITACANAACTAPHFTGGANVTLTPGSRTFAIGATGINNNASVQQTSAGAASLAAISSPAASQNSTCLNTAANSSSCAMTVADAGFIFSVPSHRAESVQNVTVTAVRKSDSAAVCVPAFAGTAKNLNFKCAYNNPATGTLPVRLGNGSATAALAADAASACSAGGNTLTLNFNAAGAAPMTLQYADAGKLSLSALYAGSGADAGLVMTGSANFIAAPSSFAFSQIAQAAAPKLANPAAVNGSGAKFIAAGELFSARVEARNTAGALTPNFGNESTAETATLSSALEAPAGGVNAAVSGALGVFVNGVATSNTLSWGEVGIMSLNAVTGNSYGYLGTAALPTSLAASGNSGKIGRFVPAYFNTAITVIGGVPMACPTGLAACAAPALRFAYSRQPFSVQTTAVNLGGVSTFNYNDTFARPVTLSAWSAAGSTALQNPPASPAGSTLNNNLVAAADFGNGIALSIIPSYSFAGAYPAASGLAPPTAIFIRAVDSDGVSSLRGAASVEGGVAIASGRLQIANNYGSELLGLPVALQAQYWNGSAYANVNTDSVTAITAAAITLAACKRAFDAGGGACKPFVSVAASPAIITLVRGAAGVRLNAPGAGNIGSVDVQTTQLPYLPGTTGREVFGSYRSPLIFIRESY